MYLRGIARPRAALAGNPSDGYSGSTVAFTFDNFAAAATVLVDSPAAGRVPSSPLINAAIRALADFTGTESIPKQLQETGIQVTSDVPYQVGLGGSSAIVISVVRAAASHLGIELEPIDIASIALAAERDHLNIPAGPQDRVAQAFGGLLYMDFGCEPASEVVMLDPAALPPLFIAYKEDLGSSSSAPHGELRRRFEEGDTNITSAMSECAQLAAGVRQRLERGDGTIGELMDRNFDIRREIGLADEGTVELVKEARACGAMVNSAGSGGAIVGTYSPDRIDEIEAALRRAGAEVIIPSVESPDPSQNYPAANP